VAGRRAAEWVRSRKPDLVAVTGDLLSRPRGRAMLDESLAGLDAFVVLGNHDVAVTRDPFSRAAELADLEEAVLLRDSATTVELRGMTVQVVGVDPETYPRGGEPSGLADHGAALRILLCHFPGIVRRLPAGVFEVILAGHLHAGQICLPVPGRRVTLAHPRAAHVAGAYERAGGLLHVSPGSGTTFVPFRFAARPEVTELVLRAGSGAGGDVD